MLRERESMEKIALEEHLNFLIMAERDNTKAFIHATVSQMKGSINSGGRAKRQPTMDRQISSPAGVPKRIGLNPGSPPRMSLATDGLKSQAEENNTIVRSVHNSSLHLKQVTSGVLTDD